jgi:hypothetical protein
LAPKLSKPLYFETASPFLFLYPVLPVQINALFVLFKHVSLDVNKLLRNQISSYQEVFYYTCHGQTLAYLTIRYEGKSFVHTAPISL